MSATHEKKKMKTALHDSFVILLLFFIFVSSENPKSSTFTNQACWCNCFFWNFSKKEKLPEFICNVQVSKRKTKNVFLFYLDKTENVLLNSIKNMPYRFKSTRTNQNVHPGVKSIMSESCKMFFIFF